MSAEEHKAAIRRMWDAWQRGESATVAAFYAADCRNHGQLVGRAGIRRVVEGIRSAFPDFHFEIEELIAGEHETVTARCLTRGTHRGTPSLDAILGGGLAGIAPTGKAMCVQNVHLFRFRDGLITEHWATRDDLGMLRQLGLLGTATRSDQVDGSGSARSG
jgi:predicted ester cyclase